MKIVFSIICFIVLLTACENKPADEKIVLFPSDTLVIGNNYPEINSELVLKVMEDSSLPFDFNCSKYAANRIATEPP